MNHRPIMCTRFCGNWSPTKSDTHSVYATTFMAAVRCRPTRFITLLGDYAYAAFLLSRYIGGQYLHRNFPDDPKGRPPFVPVPAA